MATEFDLPTPIRRLLLEYGLEVDAPYDRRIYTNRDLNLDSVTIVGFDMDYTLAIYRQDAIEQISLSSTIGKLIDRGYPEQLRLVQSHSDPAFAIRGLMVDKTFGNVVKMDRHGYVGRAFHGKTKLSRERRKELYRAQRLGMERERFAAVDTLFALPEVTLYAEVVELVDNHPELWTEGPPTYTQAWRDVRESIDEAHRDGSIKEVIKRDPASYIERDPDLARTLHKFRSAGKKLFLLTNSFFPYTDIVMRYLLPGSTTYSDWLAYFDWIVVGAAKPAFFTGNRRFQELDRRGNKVGPPKSEVSRGKIYEGGNQLGFQASLGGYADEVLYVGDHIYGDIVKSKKSSGWRTALIVQELQHELRVRRSRGMTLREIESLYTLRSQLAEEITAYRYLSQVLARLTPGEIGDLGGDETHKVLEETRLQIRRRLDHFRTYEQETWDTLSRRGLEVDSAFNPYWGSSFAERHDASRFGAQVENYACIYTSRVSNFLFFSPAKYFMSPHGSLPHW